MAGTEVLIIGSGGREEALRLAMEASNEVSRAEVYADPSEGLERFNSPVKPFVIIGPEKPLVDGLADELRDSGYIVFGASKQAARYEAEKDHAVVMMQNHGIPHPKTTILHDGEAAYRYALDHSPHDYVIKAKGLAGGKGVVLPDTRKEAIDTVQAMQNGAYDNAGVDTILFARRHSGPEVSAMVVVGADDEFTILPLSQDHKRLGEGDTGPNTGGMGAYAPLPASIVNLQQHRQIHDIAAESLAGMRASGTPYEKAVLYIGLMMSELEHGNPVVIEYNVRFGDPETQVLMPLMQAAGADMYRLLRSAAEGDLEAPDVAIANLSLSALSVCLAGAGYPGSPEKGAPIYGLGEAYDNVTIQNAAVKNGTANGGRVLYVIATGETIDQAAANAYDAIDIDHQGPASGKIGFAGMQLRRDIGHWARTVA